MPREVHPREWSSHTLTLLDGVRWQGMLVAGERVRELLAILTRHGRDGLTDTRLVEQLWAGARPANPVKALQVVVSRARSATSADAVVRTPHGYRLGLADDEVDVLALGGLAVARDVVAALFPR